MANQDVNAEPGNALTSAKDRATSPVLEQTDRSIERGKDTDTVLSAAPPDRLGVALAVAGIVLVGLNLRPAVVSLSPIYEAVARSLAMGNGARSVMGSLPVFCFAIFGALTPRLVRRIGLARSLALAMALGLTALCAVVGPTGLVLAPHVAWIWVVLAGVGATLLSVGVTLVNLRTSTEEGAGQLSGFMQGFGYLIAGTGPILVGYLYGATGAWVAPCVFLASLGVVAAAAGVIAVRPVSIEDDLASPALSHHASATPAQTIQPPGP